VNPEVSELDFTTAVNILGTSVPGLTKRRVSTVIELADGQSFAIAGLLHDSIRENVRKFPFLGDLPVLGPLFRSSEFQRKETELVVIVTAHLVKPLEMARQKLPTDGYVAPNDTEFYLMGLTQGRGGSGASSLFSGSGKRGLEGEFGHALPQ
jgi:pilus assembly protein CpaC